MDISSNTVCLASLVSTSYTSPPPATVSSAAMGRREALIRGLVHPDSFGGIYGQGGDDQCCEDEDKQ